VLSADAIKSLTDKLENINKTDSTQIAVVTIPTLNGEAIEDYSIKMAHDNGIGQKGKDNGVLFLVSVKDHKMRIEVGYGLEGQLTDAMSGRILDGVKPYFKKNDFNGGVNYAVDNIVKVVKGEYKTDTNASDAGVLKFLKIIAIIIVIVIVIIIIIAIFSDGSGGGAVFFSGGGSSGGDSGGFGGGGFGGGGCSSDW
jgi:uncharacterized protein